MTNVKMPRPIGYFECDPETLEPIWGEECICQDNVYDQEETGTVGRKMIFSDQAQSYVDERVREALEEAALMVDNCHPKANHKGIATAIRALFPKQ